MYNTYLRIIKFIKEAFFCKQISDSSWLESWFHDEIPFINSEAAHWPDGRLPAPHHEEGEANPGNGNRRFQE